MLTWTQSAQSSGGREERDILQRNVQDAIKKGL